MTACRHGGVTQLGEAALTGAQTMALSGHKDTGRCALVRQACPARGRRAKAPGMGSR
jgi:hypothetical protein